MNRIHNKFTRFARISSRVSKLGSEKWVQHTRAREMENSTPDLIILTIGEPDIPVSNNLIDICSASMKKGRTRYSNGRGEANLLKVLAEKYSNSSRCDIKEENILCFPGTQTALFLSMIGLAEENDDVLVGDPLYASYEGVIKATGATMVKVPLHKKNNFVMDPKDLEEAITPRSRVLLLNSPHNPTGAIIGKKRMEEIGDICLKNGIWIVSDEVYSELIFDNCSHEKFSSPLQFKKFLSNTVVVSSISKSHAAPGFRSGWAVGPSEFCKQLLPLSETMLFGNQPFIADMTAYALANETNTAKIMRTDYDRRAKLVVKELSNCPDLKPFAPEAGMFIMIDISRTGISCETFTSILLDEYHVATMPGSSFGEQAKGFIRMSLTVNDGLIYEACNRMKILVSKV